MKVLFTIDSLLQGGTEESIAEIIHLFSKNTEVAVCYFYPKNDLLTRYKKLNIHIQSFDLKGEYAFVQGIRYLIRYIEDWKPDLIVSSLYRASIISRIAGRIKNIPVVGTFVEENYGHQRRSAFKGWHQLKFYATWLLDRLTAHIPVAWISNSLSITQSNSKALGISASHVYTIYRGRAIDNYALFAPKLNYTDFQFCTIGRLFEKKGFSDLIRASQRLKRSFPSFKVIIYGEGPYRPTLEQLIIDSRLQDNVMLKGKTPQAVYKLYEHHCFVFPSLFEGFSGALVEAMMVGIPIIASDIPMNLEAVTRGSTARVFPVKDYEALANEMEWVMTNYPEAIEMGKKAREEAIERFDIQKIAHQYEETLRTIFLKQA